MSESTSVVSVTQEKPVESGRDPLRVMIEIAENPNISEDDKRNLILYAKERFKNRRKMAYFAIYALVAFLCFLFIAALIDGLVGDSEILAAVQESQSLFTWIGGFLTAIVAAYYGVTAWRPAS